MGTHYVIRTDSLATKLLVACYPLKLSANSKLLATNSLVNMPSSDLEDILFFFLFWTMRTEEISHWFVYFWCVRTDKFCACFCTTVVTLNSWMMSRLLSDCLLWVLSFIILGNCREALRLDYLTLILRELTDPLKKMPKVIFFIFYLMMNEHLSIYPSLLVSWW